ncbi:MAG: DUF2202 domain-containing protein [Anaerolineaceae bacterium]|nr:MAG: DUF2202 domain-containing protein [Anaerolineaceae bacterium]
MLNRPKSTTFSKLFLVALLLLAFPLAACDSFSDTATAAPPTLLRSDKAATTDIATKSVDTMAIAPAGSELEPVVAEESMDEAANETYLAPAGDLSVDEIADLLFMREEEKLARDVYLILYDQWQMPVFHNIAASEAAHMEALLVLINQYGLVDPAAGKDLGVFTDPSLQTLYDQLIADGSESLSGALLVGATIEEIDIRDLQGSLAQTANADIVPVYQNLLAGSENHLRAFASSLERQTGEVYQPQYLSQEAYATIAGGSAGNGNGNGGQGGNGGNGQGRGGNGGGQGGNGRAGQGRGGNGGQGGNGAGRGQQQSTT